MANVFSNQNLLKAKRMASLEESERRGVMAIVDARLATDKFKAEFENTPDDDEAKRRAAAGLQRLDEALVRAAPKEGQPERIRHMADVMYQVVKTLEPFNGTDRAHIVEEVRKQFLEKGKDGALGVMEKNGMGGQYIARLQEELDVLNLVKQRPRYVRQLEWLEKTCGAVPVREWLGTDRHKALAAGIEPQLALERVVTELIVESASHRAWSAIRDDTTARREFIDDAVPWVSGTVEWTRSGCPMFSLTDDFFHALAVTDFGTSDDDKEDVIHMPFHAFVMNFPPNKVLGDVRRMFVYRVPTERLGDKTTEPSKVDGEVIVRTTMEVEFPNVRLAMAAGRGVIYSQWPSTATRWQFLHEIQDRTPGTRQGLVDEDREHLEMARRILANMLSYIESNHGLPPQKHKHGAPAAPVEREHGEPRFRVGRTVKLAPQIRAALREGTTGRSWKLGHRFIVRGHFRMQAHGPKKSLRMKKWIEPFWKGPASLDAAFERTYSVEAVTVDVDVSDLDGGPNE